MKQSWMKKSTSCQGAGHVCLGVAPIYLSTVNFFSGMKKAKDLCRAVPAPVPAIPDGGADEEPTEIPDPLVPLEPEQIPDEIKKNGTLVFFDMETNGFGETNTLSVRYIHSVLAELHEPHNGVFFGFNITFAQQKA